MVFESEVPPLCRCCGKPIAKRVDQVWFGSNLGDSDLRKETFPRSKQEVQTLVNGTVISVRWQRFGDSEIVSSNRAKAGGDYIFCASVWDGVSYDDEFFCSTRCTRDLAYACAREGRVFGAYNKAIEAQKTKR